MKKRSLIVALWLCSVAVAAGQKKTAYPLTGITSIDPLLKEEGLKPGDIVNPEALNHYRYTHGAPLKVILEVVRKNNLTLKPVMYTGGFTAESAVEEGYRTAIAMSPNGRLAQALDEKATTVVLDMGEDGEFPFLASTAAGDFTKDGAEFCFWVRVGDEWMKVTAVDPLLKSITVIRGFENSVAAKHPAGRMVFTPVYRGNRRNINDATRKGNRWPGIKEPISYALDPASEATHRYKAQFIIDRINEGYAGAWWDTFEARSFNLCDPIGRGDYARDGKSIFPWNFEQGAPYNPESLLEQMKLMAASVRKIVRSQTGTEPVICANNIGGNYDWMHSIIDPGVMIDVFCIEDCFITPSWKKGTTTITSTNVRGRKSPFTFDIVRNNALFLNKLNALIRSNQDGKPLIAMTGPAGWVSGHFTVDQPNYDALERYAWCAWLLTVEANGSNLFGKPITITSDGHGKYKIAPLSDIYFYPVGNPVETKSIEQYQVDDQPLYMRRFDNGIAIISRLDQEERYTLTLPESYIDPATQKSVQQITFKGPDGALLLKNL